MAGYLKEFSGIDPLTIDQTLMTWLRLGGERKPFRLSRDVCGKSAGCLMQSRVAKESAEAVPFDRVEVRAGAHAPALMLPRGEFVTEAVGLDGGKVKEFPVRQR